MSRRTVSKLVAALTFIGGVLLLAETGSIDLDLRSLDRGRLAILAGSLALGVVLIFRFFDANYGEDGKYKRRKHRDSRK